MWAADDDLWEPSFIRTLLALLQRDARAVLAFGGFNNFELDKNSGPTYPRLAELPSRDRFTRLWRFLRQKEREGKANLIYGLMRREAVRAAGGFKAWGRGTWGADMLTLFRLLAEGNVALSPDRLFHKRATLPRDTAGARLARARPAGTGPPENPRQARLPGRLQCGHRWTIGGSPPGQRLLLRLEVARQRGYILLREGGQVLSALGKNPSGSRRAAKRAPASDRMRILYVASKYDYGHADRGWSFEHVNFYDALNRAGHDLEYFDFETLFRELGRESLSRRLRERVEAFRPGLMFCCLTGDQFDFDTVKSITTQGLTTTFNWFCDDHFRFEKFSRRWAVAFHWVSTTAACALPWYEKIGCTRRHQNPVGGQSGTLPPPGICPSSTT